MKWTLGVLILLAGCGHTITPVTPDAPTLTWTDNGNPLVPLCSSAVSVNCLTSYTLTDLTNGQTFVVPITFFSYQPAETVTVGNRTYSITVNGINPAGTISSPVATTIVTIP